MSEHPTAEPSHPGLAAARERLVLALDVDDDVAADRLAQDLRPWFATVKVGLELFCAAGPDIVPELIDDGFKVFLDLKLADIPTTVGRAARVLGALGVSYLTIHASGGLAPLRAGVEGLAEGAARAGMPVPSALAVTVLSSDADAGLDVLGQRLEYALEAGCDGVVCGARHLPEVKRRAPELLAVVPGTRPAGVAGHDHALLVTPADALAGGADLLVIGRAVTAAPDPAAAAEALATGLAVPGDASPSREPY